MSVIEKVIKHFIHIWSFWGDWSSHSNVALPISAYTHEYCHKSPHLAVIHERTLLKQETPTSFAICRCMRANEGLATHDMSYTSHT